MYTWLRPTLCIYTTTYVEYGANNTVQQAAPEQSIARPIAQDCSHCANCSLTVHTVTCVK